MDRIDEEKNANPFEENDSANDFHPSIFKANVLDELLWWTLVLAHGINFLGVVLRGWVMWRVKGMKIKVDWKKKLDKNLEQIYGKFNWNFEFEWKNR